MNSKIVAIDCGKAYTKVLAYDTKTRKITGNMIKTRAEHADSLVNRTIGEGAHIVTFPGSGKELGGQWTIGANGGCTSYSNSKKEAIHKMLTLAAIALTVDNGDSVIASVGCPLSVFSEDKERDEYLDYIFPDGRVEVTVDGKLHFFYIEKSRCMIFPESFGALFLYEKKFERNAGIVDIGGLNVNASYFQGGVLDPFRSRTEKLGYYSLISVLRNRLNALCDASFDDTEVGLFLKQGCVTNDKGSAREIDEVLDIHMKRIENIVRDWPKDNINLFFIGGTSTLLREHINKRYGKNAFIPDEAHLINCRGFLKAMIAGLGYAGKG